MSEPLADCPSCGSDGFNIINGKPTICNTCNGTGIIVTN